MLHLNDCRSYIKKTSFTRFSRLSASINTLIFTRDTRLATRLEASLLPLPTNEPSFSNQKLTRGWHPSVVLKVEDDEHELKGRVQTSSQQMTQPKIKSLVGQSHSTGKIQLYRDVQSDKKSNERLLWIDFSISEVFVHSRKGGNAN